MDGRKRDEEKLFDAGNTVSALLHGWCCAGVNATTNAESMLTLRGAFGNEYKMLRSEPVKKVYPHRMVSANVQKTLAACSLSTNMSHSCV